MEVIASKAFSAFDGIVIHGFEYGVDADKVIFRIKSTGRRWDVSINARFTMETMGTCISVFVGGVSI